MGKTGTLFMIPATLGEYNFNQTIPEYVREVIKNLKWFAVENIRTTRRYISALKLDINIEDLNFVELNKDSSTIEIEKIIGIIENGNDVGVISEAGLPGIADPGALLVASAHNKSITVKPITGPSSIILALISSGMNGQNFSFHGYLPIKKPERIQAIKNLEKESLHNRQTQIFMETPYRNQQLLDDLLIVLNENTKLCIAADITLETEFIQTKPVGSWKKKIPNIQKRPAIFIIQA